LVICEDAEDVYAARMADFESNRDIAMVGGLRLALIYNKNSPASQLKGASYGFLYGILELVVGLVDMRRIVRECLNE
jgi:hypothetical protein